MIVQTITLKNVLVILPVIIVISGVCGDEAVGDDARRKAAHRQRRMILNNDGLADTWIMTCTLGLDSTLKIIPGTSHGGTQFHTDVCNKRVLELFNRHLAAKK